MQIEFTDSIHYITIPEKCDLRCSQELMQLGKQCLTSSKTPLYLDFSNSKRFDSCCIGTLVALTKDYRNSDERLVLRNLSDHQYTLLVEGGLHKVFEIEKDGKIVVPTQEMSFSSEEIKLEMEREVRNNVCIFHLNGIMNHPAGSRFFRQRILLALIDFNHILLDLKNLTFLDSHSVSVFIQMNGLLRSTGGKLRVCSVNFIIDELFSALNINELIPCFSDVDKALENWVDV